jgi:hypothetical protein
MSWTKRVLGIAVVLAGVATLAACGWRTPKLEPEKRLALEIRPAIVRVNAYATGTFSYPTEEIRKIAATVEKAVPGTVVRRLSGIGHEDIESGTGASGSGFIINPAGYILTSAALVRSVEDRKATEVAIRRNGAEAALVRHFTAEPLRKLAKEKKLEPLVDRLAAAGSVTDLSFVEDVELANGERYGFDLRRTSDQAAELNVAVIRVRRRNLPSIRVGVSAPVRVDDPLWIVGYPSVVTVRDEVVGGWLLRDADLESSLNPGVVTSVGTDPRGRPRLVTNAAMYLGNAGGAAVSRGDGSVIGIALPDRAEDAAKSVVPIDPIRQIVEDAGVIFDDGGDFQTTYRLALDKIERGRLRDARGELAYASQLFPNYPDVVRFVAEAERLDEKGSLTDSSIVVVGLLSFAVVLLGALAAHFALRARHAESFGPPAIPQVTHESWVSPSSRDGSGRVPETGEAMLGRLTILSGDRAGERIGLGGSGIRVGREQVMCEIVFENPKVSRLHAEFVEMDGRVLLIDRNSSNGTYVNDRKIDKRFLEDGDIIYFGGRNAIAVAFHA